MAKPKISRNEIDEVIVAVRAGKVRRVIQLLAKGISPNARDRSCFGATLLMVAAKNGHENVFMELVKAGANLHAVDDLKSSVLQEASAGNGTARMVEAIIADGLIPSDGLLDALRNACSEGKVETVKVLLKAGADVNGQDKDFGTPLTCAVAWNQPKTVAVLLKSGARTDFPIPRDVQGGDVHYKKTMLELAIAEGFIEVVKMLKAAGAKVPSKPKRSAKPDTVEKSWKRIDQWIKQNAPKWKPLKKGASPTQIQNVESKLGFKMPEDLRNSYLIHAGANDDAQIFPSPDNISHFLMPLTEVAEEWAMMKELLETGDFKGCKPKSDRGIRNEWWNSRWIPIASNGGGDFFCIDLAPAAGGKKGQVITHNHESGHHKLLASSLREWLYILANGLEDKRFSFDTEGGLV